MAQIPALFTHKWMPKEDRDKAGILENFVRFSIGIENVEDLIEDVKQALAQI